MRAACRLLQAALSIAAAGAFADAFADESEPGPELARPAARIVSLAPHVTELLFAAGAGDRLVGAVAYSDHPEAAQRLPRVGDAHALDIERIVALQPDLVVAWRHGNPPRQVDAVRAAGLAVHAHEAERLEQIAESIQTLGALAGTAATAQLAAQAFSARLAALRARHAGQAPVRVFVQLWRAPLLTINRRHMISDVVSACGGSNVFAEQPMRVPQPGVEAVLQADPEVIVGTGTPGDESASFDAWRAWPQLTAVARGNLVLLPADTITRNTPRILDGAQTLCAALEAARAKRHAPSAARRE